VVLYYALGGGLGHLTRARQVLEALGWVPGATVLTASPYALDARVTGGLPVIHVPDRLGRSRAEFRFWLEGLLEAARPSRLIVDSFPGGILGELCGMALPPAIHVGRRLRWRAYAQRLHAPLPPFEVGYLLEPLGEAHEHALVGASRSVEPIELPVPRDGGAAPLVEEPHWLVVHSGPDAETVELIEHAAELRTSSGLDHHILVVSPRPPSWLPDRASWRDIYPITPHLAGAERILTAAGFNVMRETAALRDRHHFIPFPRPLDDQYARAAAAMRQIPHSSRTRPVTLHV
jgi:hypothetical protein